MPRKYPQLTYSDSVKAVQTQFGTRQVGEKMEAWEMDDEHLSDTEVEFIGERDSFYMASSNEDGWPYVQFRGGPKGFLKVLDDKTLGYADFRGNKQYISTGNLSANNRVSLFFMDYAAKRRLKLMAHTRFALPEASPELLAKLEDERYPARIERLVLFELVAFDWNCPQHITRRFTSEEWSEKDD
jgi:predicted pyridoxine 5'-phosphate oxidase superfamily flavin-nucleotide-binding protein